MIEYLIPDIANIVDLYIKQEVKWTMDTTTHSNKDIFEWKSQITCGYINLVYAKKLFPDSPAYCQFKYKIEFKFQQNIKGFIYQYSNTYKNNITYKYKTRDNNLLSFVIIHDPDIYNNGNNNNINIRSKNEGALNIQAERFSLKNGEIKEWDEEKKELLSLQDSGFWCHCYAPRHDGCVTTYTWIENITLLELQQEMSELQKILDSQKININIASIIFKNLF